MGLFRSKRLRVEEKADLSVVTEADLRIEEVARALIAERHPELGVLGEERGAREGSSGDRLIIDPIDSTANFARGVPIFGTLLAIEAGEEVVAGVVSAPALRSRWTAARGAGAYAGSQRMQVSRIRDLSKAQLFHGSLAGGESVRASREIFGLMQKTWRQRGFGDFYQHVLVADGAVELAIDPIMNPWDIAPLFLLVEEAGGRASSLSGIRSIHARSLVTSNGLLHDEALAALRTGG
jgi:histidinol-phosphatase